MKYKRIGLLEDHLLVAESVKMQAEQWGFSEFIHYQSAAALMSDLKGGLEFDLLLLDLGVPNSDVEHTFTSIRAKYPHLKVLFLSGSKVAGIVSRLMKMGARGFVSKMAGWEEVGVAVKLVLSGEIYIDSRMYSGNLTKDGDPFDQLSSREFKVCSCNPSAQFGHNDSKNKLEFDHFQPVILSSFLH